MSPGYAANSGLGTSSQLLGSAHLMPPRLWLRCAASTWSNDHGAEAEEEERADRRWTKVVHSSESNMDEFSFIKLHSFNAHQDWHGVFFLMNFLF